MAVRPEHEVRWGLVAEALTGYKHAVMLARGIDAAEQAQLDQEHDTGKLRERESRSVAREDMEAAHAIASEVRQLFVEWQNRYSTVRWPGRLEFGVRTTMNAASDATKHLVAETRQILDGSPPGAGQVRSLLGGWPLIWVQYLYLAYEPLQIIEGEVPLAESAIAQAAEFVNDYDDFVLTVFPVVGEVVLAYEAAFGSQLVGGRKLSTLERVVDVVGLILPYALGALVKEAPKVGIAFRRFRVNLVRLIPKSAAAQLDRFTADMVIGLRSLPKESFEKFLRIIRVAGPLTPDQAKSINFFMSRIDYASRLAQWLQIIERRVGKELKGVHVLLRPAKVGLKAHEQAMMEKLSRLTGKPVVAIPEIHPREYEELLRKMTTTPEAALPQVTGVKYPDTVWNGELAELYQVEGGTSEKVLRKTIADKGKQASTLVVTNGPNSTFNLPSLFDQRFWSWPEGQYVNKVVILFDQSVRIIERPARYITMDPKTYLITRALTGNPAHLVRTAEEVGQAEEEEKKGAKR
jgi:hypothetical protein